MVKLTPRERRHQKTKQAILQAAREIINEKGVDRLSLRELAHRIDYSPASLYEYFNSKDEIMAALCIEGFERLGEYLNRVPADLSPAERLTALGQAYLDFAQHNPEHFMLIFTTLPSNKVPATDWDINDSPYTILQQAVQAVVEAEGIKLPTGYTLNDLVFLLWSQVHGMAMLQRTIFCHHDCNIDDLYHWMVEVWRKGLR